MIIYIPTYGRVGKQVTLNNLPEPLRKKAVLVVYEEEASKFGAQPILVCPSEVRGIAAKRQFIVDKHDHKRFGPQICMLDDDLRFYKRRMDDLTKFEPASDLEKIDMFTTISFQLLRYSHVGVMGREGANRVTEPFTFCTRMMRILAYDVAICRKHKIDFKRGGNMCDFDATLQLLELGLANCVLAHWVQDQGSSNAPGGCSITRSLEVQSADARKLAEVHPKYVKLVEKTTKVAWGGATRLDVQVQWKKAYNDAASR